MIHLLSSLLAVMVYQPAGVSAPPSSIVVDFSAPPAGPLPPLAGEVAPAIRARANLPSLFTTDDYPADARLFGEAGTVTFAVAIDRDGRVSDCTVTDSSGSASLDLATCSIIQRRARYIPARDVKGRAVTDRASGRIRWQLPPARMMPFADRKTIVVFTTDSSGKVVKCRVEDRDAPSSGEQICKVMMPTAQQKSAVMAPQDALPNRELIIEQGLLIGAPEGAATVGRGPGVTRRRLFALAIEIDPAGTIAGCTPVDESLESRMAIEGCKEITKTKFMALSPAAGNQAVRRAVRYWASYSRSIR